MPCGHTNMPPPKLLISLPVSSKWWTGFALVPRQPGAIPGEQRSVAHTDLPSLSMATPLEPPQGLFSRVSCAQSRMTRYGWAPPLTGATSCAWAAPISKAIPTITAAVSQPLMNEIDIAALLGMTSINAGMCRSPGLGTSHPEIRLTDGWVLGQRLRGAVQS